MFEAREWANWNRAAALMAKMHNLQCTKKSDMKQPPDFHPYMAPRRRLLVPPENVGDFAKLAKKAFRCEE